MWLPEPHDTFGVLMGAVAGSISWEPISTPLSLWGALFRTPFRQLCVASLNTVHLRTLSTTSPGHMQVILDVLIDNGAVENGRVKF